MKGGRIIPFGMAALLALSCSREEEPAVVPQEPEGRVELTFTLVGDTPSTKTLGEEPELETLHLAIFGGSGYLKEYVEATRKGVGTYEYEYLDSDGVTTRRVTVPQYTYSVSIALSNSGRRVHFIGNGPSSIPFGRDSEVLPSLLGEKETGFWQMITLSNVTALQDADGDYVYPDLGTKRGEGDPYLPSADLQAAFSNIPLIRNWAKIELSSAPAETSHFTPYSFAVVDVPKHGTLVPYGGEKGFIDNYKDLSFEELRGAGYNYGGNLPVDVEFDHSIPSAEDFVPCTDGAAVYLYERPVPSVNMEPTYVIVYGLYKNGDDAALTDEEKENGVRCYYKIDLMSGGEYYPVLRNFKYKIQIDKISARGHDTPGEAAAAAGSADVSADINAATLSDISDGTRRMAVQPWMSKTFIRAQEKSAQLYVVFYDDITADEPVPNLSEDSVTWELIPSNAGIVKEVEIGAAVDDASASNYGWRPVSFAIASPEEASARSQTLRIRCTSHPGTADEASLYRDVVISLLPTQTMRVSCKSERVLLVKGEPQRVDVAIPDGLVQSMFPLRFIIEAQELTLTPDGSVEGNNLPVISEASIVDGHHTFHFQRTLEWEEYESLPSKMDYEDESLWRTFSSYFTTNCEQSATAVYVSNEFFYTAGTSFSNYASFRSPRFTTSVPCESGRSVTATARLMSEGASLDRVYLDLEGLVPADGSGILHDEAEDEYYYDPSAVEMTFSLVTTTDDGNVSVTLRSKTLPYEPMRIEPWRFRDMQIMDMATAGGTNHTGGGDNFAHVAYGYVSPWAGKQFLVGYYTEPESYEYLTGNQKLSTSIVASSGVVSVGAWNDTGNISATARDYYREKWFTTLAGPDPVSVTFSSAGYVEETVTAPRFWGNIYYTEVSSANDWNTFLNNGNIIERPQTINYVNGKFTLSISGDKALEKHGDSNGIVLPAGGHYELDASAAVTNSDLHLYLYYAQIFYYVSGTTALRPRSVDPSPDGSIYYGYLGNNNEYMWNLPWGETGGSLLMNAPSNQDIVITRIILRGFHGLRNDSGDAGGGDIGLGDGLKDGGGL